MFQVIFAEFKHETNTFSTQITDLSSYQRRRFATGHEMIKLLRGTRTESAGVLDTMLQQPDVDLIPVVSADAMPAGRVSAAFHQDICGRLIAAIRETGSIDGVLLCLHGAMVTETSEDGEGDLLMQVRQAVGPDAMIVATLDLHANITEKMQRYANALIPFDYYPHTDMYERGQEAAQMMLRALRGEIKPTMVCASVPIALPPLSTEEPAMKKFVDLAHDRETMPGVLSVGIAHGFVCADIQELGMTVVAVTDQNPELADKISTEFAAALWRDRHVLKPANIGLDEAMEAAAVPGEGPLVLADLSDNPGGGSTCDGTHILKAMIAAQIKKAAVAHIFDPESVQACEKAGVGQTVPLRLGGKLRPDILGTPVECNAYVKMICDGRYVNRGPMSGGIQVDLQKSAVVMIDDIAVIISSNVTQPYDLEIFYAHGIDPLSKQVLLLKSTIHFRAAFGPIARKILNVSVPGLTIQDPLTVSYTRCRRPIYPLD